MHNSSIIQVLRGLSAVAVVVFHQQVLFPAGSVAQGIAAHLYLGVDLFFIISGFVIGVSTTDAGKAAVAPFLVRRVFRIVPLAWAVILLQLLIVRGDPGLVLSGLLFLPTEGLPYNPPQWSLTFEFFFYLLFAAAMALSHRYRCEICIGAILAICAVYAVMAPPQGWFCDGDRLAEFAVGLVMAKCLLHAPPTLVRRHGVALGLGVAACGLALLSVRPLEAGLSGFGGAATVMLAGLLLAERYRPLRMPRVLLRLGDLSYAIYIVQHFASIWLDSKVFWTPLHKTWIYAHASGLSRLALVLGVTLAISVLLHLVVEMPFMRFGQVLARRLRESARPQLELGQA